jgi:hypothetical protein
MLITIIYIGHIQIIKGFISQLICEFYVNLKKNGPCFHGTNLTYLHNNYTKHLVAG